jgi:hypothetical protein
MATSHAFLFVMELDLGILQKEDLERAGLNTSAT